MKLSGRVYRNHIAVKKIEKTPSVQKKVGNKRDGGSNKNDKKLETETRMR